MLALLIAGLLAGCGGGEEGGGGGGEKEKPAAPAATQSAADAEADVREAFTAYNAALEERDYDGACDRLAPETTAKLQQNLEKAGMKNPPDDCSEMLAAIYKATGQDPSQKKVLDEVVKTAKIDSIKVTGDKAVINWNATVGGNKTPVSQSARRIDGEWKLIDVTN